MLITPVTLLTKYQAPYETNPIISKNFNSENITFTQKASAENYKANYLCSFKGEVNEEQKANQDFSDIIHETHFFREPKTDEIVQDYILQKFGYNDSINIVSGACSTGEEAKSYAMMLDILGDKLHISGFDISDEVIKCAGNNSSRLLLKTDVENFASYDTEQFLAHGKIGSFTPYERKMLDKFRKYYHKSGKEYKEPAIATAQQQLDELLSTIIDKGKYQKKKTEYEEGIKKAKEELRRQGFGDAAKFLNMSFDEDLKVSIQIVEKQTKMFNTFQNVEAEPDSFKTCTFQKGDVLNVGELYEPNSINVLLYRNALYHTLCMGNHIFRVMKPNAEKIMDSIAKQFNKVVKKDGLVVFGEEETIQTVDMTTVDKCMQRNGFKKYIHNGEEMNNIYVKTTDV